MRFLCSIFDRCSALCQRCSHHDIDCRSDTDNVQINVRTAQMGRFRRNHAMRNLNRRAQCLEPFDMLVDCTAADIAAARQYNRSLFIFSKKGSQKVIGCPDFLDRITINR